MAGVVLPLDDARRVQVVPTGETRGKFKYRDGKVTDEPVVIDNGKQVFAFDAAVAVDGRSLGAVRVESPIRELPELPFGTVLTGVGTGELRVMPRDQFNVRVTVVLEGSKDAGAK